MTVDDIIIETIGAVRLSEVCHWFGLNPDQALKRASAQQLPVPVFKGKSQKSPWLVKLEDIRTYMDSQYSEHKDEFTTANGV